MLSAKDAREKANKYQEENNTATIGGTAAFNE